MDHPLRADTHSDATSESRSPRTIENAERDDRGPYTSPKLLIYGNLEQLTATVGTIGKKDGRGSRRTGY